MDDAYGHPTMERIAAALSRQCRADWMEKYLQELDRSGDLDAKEDRAWFGAMTTIIAKERTLLTAPHQRKMDKAMRLDPSFAARCSEFLARSLRPDLDDVLVAARVPAAVADLFFVVRLCAHIVKGKPAIQLVSACIREAAHETLNKNTYTLPLELAAFRASRAVSLFGPCSSLESLEDGPWPAASRIMRRHSPRDVYNAFIAFSYETWTAFHMCARTMADQELHCIFDHARRDIFCETT